MCEGGYIFSTQKDEEELGRLRLQTNVFDPVTIRHLETIGVAEGWKCLEIGAGTGSIAEWLSKRVGPTGKVVATDIDMRFLHKISATNLEVRGHDILKDELEQSQYDLVHCRKLLHHLREPEKAVNRMADAVRPSGWLLLEEDDWGSGLSTDVTNPSAAAYTATIRALIDFLRRRGIIDFYIGRRVRSLVEQLGFVDVSQEGWTCVMRGSDPLAGAIAASWLVATKPMISEKLLTQEQVETVERLFLDPGFYYLGYTLFSAWGRKPV